MTKIILFSIAFILLLGVDGAADDVTGVNFPSGAGCPTSLNCITWCACAGNQCVSSCGCVTNNCPTDSSRCPTGASCPTGSDCATGATCTTNGACVTTSGCTTSANCPTGSGCTTNTQCTTSTNCPTTSGCVTTTDCTTGANCPTTCGCVTTSQCTTSGACVTTTECTTSANCPTGSGCTTTSQCTTNANCPTTSGCATTTGCTTGANCPSSSDCVTSTSCITGVGCTTGSSCTTGSGCPTGTNCVTGEDCPTGSSCPVAGGCDINPQFPTSNGIITGDLCPTGSNCPSEGSCPSGGGCPTALLCPTFSGCTTSGYCPTGSGCTTGMSCPTGAGCSTGPECEPSCPRDLTCPSCSVATQNSHAENLQRLMASSLRTVECYSYNGNSETSTTFSGNGQSMAQDSSSHEQNEGYLDLADLACKLSSKSTRTDNEGGSTEFGVQTYIVGNHLYTCDNKEWRRCVVSDSAGAIEERDDLKSLTNMVAGSKAEMIGREPIDGETCYKLRFIPDPEVGRRILASQALIARSASPDMLPDIGMDALANDDNLLNEEMVWTAWVSADDYLLRQVMSEMTLSLTPESLHPSQEVKDLSVKSASQKVTTFSGFNEKKTIVLPDEARYAKIVSA